MRLSTSNLVAVSIIQDHDLLYEKIEEPCKITTLCRTEGSEPFLEIVETWEESPYPHAKVRQSYEYFLLTPSKPQSPTQENV
jgi:hypothetical protein